MDGSRQRRALELLITAKKLLSDERTAFLDEACRDDPELRTTVEALLDADRAAGFPSDALADLTSALMDDLAAAMVPERIGPFRIVREIGRGGMGVVYLAEQDEPIRRRVAVKLVKWGMDTENVIARFESERQALALMEHPAIAKIFDAGATPDGRPYFAMEYVPGIPITEHCDQHHLTNGERLELFLQVCEGVQHAHQKAVIHRDLKPSNVLVSIQDDRAAVKIIDFGLAKALAQRLTEQTLYTDLGVMIGTPEYMSPEQAARTGQDVDTRSDVYSLGVMLYELLVGSLPFDRKELQAAGFDEILRKIRDDDPPRPSVRLSAPGDRSTEAARRRRTDPRALFRELRGDLDWITMRALEKDRTRRYGSPGELAEDIRRHLKFEPVLAHAPSARYRAWRFVRRHRLAVTAAAVMLVGLSAGTIGSTLGVVRARRAEAHARRDAEVKAQVVEFMKNMFRVSNPSEAMGNKITAREILDKGAETIDTQLSGQPGVRAELQVVMGDVYQNLGLYPEAERLYSETLAFQRSVLGPEHPDTLGSVNNLALLYRSQGRYLDAERLLSETLEIRKRVQGPEHPDTLRAMSNLASVYEFQGRFPEAEQLDRQVLELRRRVLPPDHPDTLGSMSDLANVYHDQGRYEEAEKLHAETLDLRTRVLGAEHPDTATSMNNLATMYLSQGRYSDAERLFSRALEIRRRVLPPEHPDTLSSMNNLASAYMSQGHYPEAQRLYSESLEVRKRVLGPEHPSTVGSMNNLAIAFWYQNRYPEAGQLISEVLEIRTRTLTAEHPDTLATMNNLALVYQSQGRHSDAERLYSRVLEIQTRLQPEHPDTLGTMYNLALVYQSEGRYPEAERLATRALEAQTRVLPPGHRDVIESMIGLAKIRLLRGDRASGLSWVRRAVESGLGDADGLMKDPGLEALHGPEFDALVATARRKSRETPDASSSTGK